MKRYIDLGTVYKILVENGYTQTEVARIFATTRQSINQAIHAHKAKARREVAIALKSGKLVKPDRCINCQVFTATLEAHHPDHYKPLEVVWLCRKCHGQVHRKLV